MIETITEKAIRLPPNMKDYESVTHNFSWDRIRRELDYDGHANAADVAVLRNKTKRDLALIWKSQEGRRLKFTFSDLLGGGIVMSKILKDEGISKGDRVLLFSKRVPALYFSLVGISILGGVIVPVFPSFASEALKYRIDDSGAKIVIAHEELVDRVPSSTRTITISSRMELLGNTNEKIEFPQMSLEDPFFIMYTSGSTGRPKGIWHSLDVLTFFYVSGKYHFDLHPQDIFWHTGDTGWIAGFAGVWTSWLNGVPIVSYEGRFDPEKWYSIIESNRVTVISTSPTALRLLKKAGKDTARKYDISSVRFVHAGGEHVDPDIVKWGEEIFHIPVHDGYGQTETATYVVANYLCIPIKLGSMGKTLPGVNALIVDENGNEIPHNTPGVLAFKPDFPAMAKGIWGSKERWDACFRNGYYLTGDIAYQDTDGYFWYLGRADDIIKVSGIRVSPVEIEGAIMRHEAIAEASVIGIPDSERGTKIKAYVVLRASYAPSQQLQREIKEMVRLDLASHMVPKEIVFVGELPHTLSGKLMRRLLRAAESGEVSGDLSMLENPNVLETGQQRLT